MAKTYASSKPDELSDYAGSSGPFSAFKPDAELNLPLGKKGLAADKPVTVLEAFKACATSKLKDTKALEANDGREWTWAEYHADSVKAGKALVALGLERFGAVNVIGFNSPEWFFAMLGAQMAGGKGAGVYTTNGPESCHYIAEHSEACAIFVEDEKQLAKYVEVADKLPKLKALVLYSGAVPAGATAGDGFSKVSGCSVPVYTWAEFLAKGNDVEDSTLEARTSQVKPGHCGALIYTSGTTGPPKAVMISQDNATFTAMSLLVHQPVLSQHDGQHRLVSYLPLSHIAALMLDVYAPMMIVSTLGKEAYVAFAGADALRGTLKATLQKVRPTIFFGVPRVWEKFAEGIQAMGAKNTGLKKTLSTWAKGKGLAEWKGSQVGATANAGCGAAIAGKILGKVKVALGLDKALLFVSGAAPIRKETLSYMGSLGIPIVEVYGMSECTGPVTCGKPDYFRVGSTGITMPGMEIKIDHVAGRDAEGEGEVCYRGRNIMMGYMKQEEKTAETIDSEGFLHSGDVGKVDSDGLLSITGRIKELIIGAGGENIAPVPIEDKLKKYMPKISNVMMVGDKRKYNIILVTLCQEGDAAEGGFNEKLAGQSLTVSKATTVAEAKADPVWTQYINDAIASANKEAVSNAQKVQKFVILDTDFSVGGNELTATLKLKRDIVNKKYMAVIDEVYGEVLQE